MKCYLRLFNGPINFGDEIGNAVRSAAIGQDGRDVRLSQLASESGANRHGADYPNSHGLIPLVSEERPGCLLNLIEIANHAARFASFPHLRLF